MKQVLIVLMIISQFIFISCSYCEFRNGFSFLFSQGYLENCSNTDELKESILNKYECFFSGSYEKYRHVDSLFWRINETDSTYEVIFIIKSEIRLRDNILTDDYYVQVSKNDCKIIQSHKL
jgi:hypothetical protein